MHPMWLAGWARSAVAAAIGATAVLALTGCGGFGPETCSRPDNEVPRDYKGGTVDNGVYMSADWDGEWLHFFGGAHYRIFHQLGERPRSFQVYLSFERFGLRDATVAHAAGNQAEIKEIDVTSVRLLNGSCADYWLMFVASAGAP